MSAHGVPRPFTPRTDPHVIDDLHARLGHTRWIDSPTDSGWSAGTDVDYLSALTDYWLREFDWPATETMFTRFPNVLVTVGGIDLHAIHAVADGDPMPLLLAHGWPDSCWRYLKVIDRLTDPTTHGGEASDAFTVIVPDMPGFGYSGRPTGPPLDSRGVAAAYADLMTSLGYTRFAVAGGDMGSHVARYLALDFPERVVAVHRMDAGLPPPGIDPGDLTAAERIWVDEARTWSMTEGGYAAIQSTKPQTLAIGLNDSPVGLAAWIVEKLRSWSDCDGDLDNVFTIDEILALITQYWVTGTIGSSIRMYWANAAIPMSERMRFVEVPSGFTLFGGDVLQPPREWLHRTANTVFVSECPHGGHFAPFEVPDIYVDAIRAFFRPFR